MSGLAEFYQREAGVDIVTQVASILDFLAEALGAVARGPDGLSPTGADGLAAICLQLSLLCEEAANK